MSSNRYSPPPSSRLPPEDLRRSVRMYNRLAKLHDSKEDIYQITVNDKPFLNIDGINHRILDGDVTDFSDQQQPIVQMGVGRGQELVILDPSSPFLNKVYDDIKELIQADLGPSPEPNAVINYTMGFVRAALIPQEAKLTSGALKARVNDLVKLAKETPETPSYHKTPAFTLDSFIREGIGVCRHHGLLMAYLMDNFIKDGLLEPGTVFYHRDTLEGERGHAWAMYKPIQADQEQYKIYLVDSMWRDEALDLMVTIGDNSLNKYGESVIAECVRRYNKSDLETVPYTSLQDNKLQKDFIYALLDANEGTCRKLLNHQYALGACQTIKDALSSGKYKQHENYKAVLADVKRALNSEYLHSLQYNAISNLEDRQQFVLALLCKSEDARNAILIQQDANSIIQLQSLIPTQVDLFKQFESFKTLTKELEISLNLKLLHQMPYSQIDQPGDRQQFMKGLLLCSAEQRNEIFAKQDVNDLKRMKQSLENNHPERKGIYELFDAYPEVLEQIKLKMLLHNNYDSLKHSDRRLFVKELLSESKEGRHSILDQQNIYDLEHLSRSLKTIDSRELPKRLESDVNRRLEGKNLLHLNSYAELSDHNVKREFVKELKKCSLEERDEVLKKQDSTGLNALKLSLYRLEPYDKDLVEEVEKRIALNVILLMETIILSEKLKVKQTTGWSAKLWTAGKKIDDIRVPTSAKDIYKKIQGVDLLEANSKDLNRLIQSIRESATNSSKNQSSNRDADTTQKFLNILQIRKSNALFEALEDFNQKTPSTSPNLRNR